MEKGKGEMILSDAIVEKLFKMEGARTSSARGVKRGKWQRSQI